MKLMAMLVRRELWEHKALWIAPLVVLGVLLVGAVFGTVNIDSSHVADSDAPYPDLGARAAAIYAVMTAALTMPQFIVMMVVLFSYLIDSLYSERKDRSILFWKSLPISDRATVLSKFLVGLVLVPLGVYLLCLVSSLVFSALFTARLAFADAPVDNLITWNFSIWLRVQFLMLAGLLVAMLWYAPIASYLLLLSAWARRNVFLWALLPPIVVMVLERAVLGTANFKAFLGDRLTGMVPAFLAGRGRESVSIRIGPGADDRVPSLERVYEQLDPIGFLTSPGLWLGLAAAAMMLFAAIRLRRYRDDT